MAEVIINGRALNSEERRQIYICLSCRLGIIETGEPAMRAVDAVNSGQGKKVKALSIEQKKLTILLEEIMHEIL